MKNLAEFTQMIQTLGSERPNRFLRLNLKVGQYVQRPKSDGMEEREVEFLMSQKLLVNLEGRADGAGESGSTWKLPTSKNRGLLD